MPPDVDLASLALRVSYEGSAEHKTYPSASGGFRPRADATKCDPKLHGDLDRLTAWLRSGVAAGHVAGPWEGEYPRYVWTRQDDVWYEARLINHGQGTYKGWAVLDDELPEGL